MHKKIAPCPFCGRSVAKLRMEDKGSGWYVECDNPCYARGPMHEGSVPIDLWNNGLPRGDTARIDFLETHARQSVKSHQHYTGTYWSSNFHVHGESRGFREDIDAAIDLDRQQGERE